MSTTPVRVLLPDGTEAANLFDGSPELLVDVEIDSRSVLKQGRALIDTGSSISAIHEMYLGGCTLQATVPHDTMNGPKRSNQYFAIVRISGLPGCQGVCLIGSKTRFDFILGRDLLRYYRLQLDPQPSNCSPEEL